MGEIPISSKKSTRFGVNKDVQNIKINLCSFGINLSFGDKRTLTLDLNPNSPMLSSLQNQTSPNLHFCGKIYVYSHETNNLSKKYDNRYKLTSFLFN